MAGSDPDADTELMLRLQAGDDTVLNRLMTAWQTPLVRFIYRYIGNREEAFDLAQETFVRVYQARASYRPKTKFSSWLFTIASNLCRNYKRWEHRHPTVAMVSEDGETDMADSYPGPEKTPRDTAAHNDMAAKVRDSIQSLPHDLKTVVLLFEYEDLSYEEIAGVLGVSAKAVETRLYRARKLLKEMLEGVDIGQ
ncbi:MAG: RNA polymerase sigma factor [Chthoniobacteraceae bacterium]